MYAHVSEVIALLKNLPESSEIVESRIYSSQILHFRLVII